MRTLQENINQVNSDFNAIKAKIVEKGVEVADGTKTEEYAAKVGAVYEAGKKAEYDKFWDNYQQNGSSIPYYFMFAGVGWNPQNFYPKYNIIPRSSCRYLFASAGALIHLDIAERLDELGITFDTSNVTASDGFQMVCEYSGPKGLPAFDTRGCSSLGHMFFYASTLETVRKLILKEDGSQTFVNAFIGCTNLKNIIIEGVIGKNGFDIHWSTKLSKASITSIINALSTTTTGLTVTLSKVAKEAAFTADEWAALIATKTNWTISLV